MTHWVLIANSSFAEIFSVENGKEIKKLKLIDFPEGRAKGSSFVSDKPGRGFERVGRDGKGSRHALTSDVDPHEHELQLFVHKLADELHKAKSENAFSKLSIIAPPHFLGELRSTISLMVKESIDKEINKDIPEYMSEGERIDALCKYLEIKRPKSLQA